MVFNRPTYPYKIRMNSFLKKRLTQIAAYLYVVLDRVFFFTNGTIRYPMRIMRISSSVGFTCNAICLSEKPSFFTRLKMSAFTFVFFCSFVSTDTRTPTTNNDLLYLQTCARTTCQCMSSRS